MHMQLGIVDWVVIAAYLVATITLGLAFAHRAGRSVEDFFLAGRKLPWYLAGGSMVAGMFAADTPLFHTGNVRDLGLSACWLFFAPVFGAMAAAAIFARLVRRSRVVTDAEYIELRYSGKTPAPYRGFLAFYSGIFVASLTMGWVTLGMCEIISQLVGWPKNITVVILLTIEVLYASAAGMWGVVMTDILQYIIGSLGSLFLAIAAVRYCGGLTGLREKLAVIKDYPGSDLHYLPTCGERALSPNAIYMSISLLIAWIAVNGMDMAASAGHRGQRILACRSTKDASLSFVMFSLCYYGINGLCWVVAGLASVVVLGSTNQMAGIERSTRAFPEMIAKLMPMGLKGLMMAAMMASFMSATSVLLNWGSSYMVNDFYRRFVVRKASQRHYVFVSRLACVLLAVLGGVFSLQFESLQDYFSLVPSLLMGPVVVLLARHVWWRTNIWSEVAAMVSAPLVGFYVEYVLGARGHWLLLSHLPLYGIWESADQWYYFGYRLMTTVGLTTLCSLLVTFATQPTDMEKLKNYYVQVQPPGPGWLHVRKQLVNPPPAESGWLLLGVWFSSVVFVLGAITAVVEYIRGNSGMMVGWIVITLISGVAMNRGLSALGEADRRQEGAEDLRREAAAKT